MLDETDKKEQKNHSKLAIVGYSVMWLIAWPITILIIAVSFFILFNLLFHTELSAQQPTGASMRATVALFAGVLVIVCLVLIGLQRKSKDLVPRIGAKVLAGYMWLGIMLTAGLVVNISDNVTSESDAGIHTQATNNPLVPVLQHDPTIVALMQEIGAKDTDLIDQSYVAEYNDPAFPTKQGEYQAFTNSATGGFVYGKLTVKQGLNREQEKRIIAHEYLHHVWFKAIDASTKESLTAQLIALYGNNAVLREQVKNYADTGSLQPTELFSYLCTEWSDEYMTQPVLDQCNAYINRQTLQLLY